MARVMIRRALPSVTIPLGADIQAAVDAAPVNTWFMLATGTHRPSASITPKTGQAFIGETGAVLSGGRVLTSPTGSNPWVYGGQTQQGTVNDLGGQLCEVGNPLCGVPEDVFFDDVPLFPVASVGAGGPGEFYFDYAANNIYIWDDPSGHVVETSVIPTAFTLGAATGVAIRNLIIEKYATPTENHTVTLGTGWVLEDCEVRHNHYGAVRMLSNSIARNNNLHHNGGFGISGVGNDILVEDNEIAYNNYALLNPYFGAVVKFVFTEDLIVRGNFSHHNHGNGLWTDISNNNTLYEDNTCEENYLSGIFHEISYAAIIRNNECSRNGLAQDFTYWVSGAGIAVTRSSDVEVYENDLFDNWQGIVALDDNRNNAVDETHGPWDMVNLNVHDNRIHQSTDLGVGSGNTGIVQFEAGSAPYEAGANNHFENNDYWFGSYADYFMWSAGSANETEWVAFGHDDTGSFTRPYTLVANVAAGSVSGASVTTAAINTTPANLLIVTVSDADDNGFGTVSDNKGNTSWVPLTVRTNGAFAVRSRIYYHSAPVVGTGHTFTYTISSAFQFPSINALAFSGAHASPFDVQNGAINVAAPPLSTGLVTPNFPAELILTALAFDSPANTPTIDNGFTITDTVAQQGGNHYGSSAAWKVSTAAVNPAWNWTGGAAGSAVTIATFKAV